MYVLAINPGAVTTKVAVFHNETQLFEHKFEHFKDDLKPFHTVFDQYDYRMELILNYLKERQFDITQLNATVGRGGLLKPIAGGTYLVNEKMLEDLREARRGEHASNLGAALAYGIAQKLDISAFIVDPVAVDELTDVARITGLPEIQRVSLLHALNHKAVARSVAATMGKRYDEVNFVVAHLGTGTSVAAHCKGRVVDMCDARGEGPFSCERSGGVNSYLMMELAFSGKYTRDELKRKISSQSGLFGHLGTKDAREVEQRAQAGEAKAKLILDAMIYQTAKEIGAQSAALGGKVDKIIITGGIAYSPTIMKQLSDMVSFIAPVHIVPGEEELPALAQGALRVLNKEETPQIYS